MPSTSATSLTKKFLNNKAEDFNFKDSYFEERKEIKYNTFNERYYQFLDFEDFECQFLHLYNYRLEVLKPICLKLATEKWSKEYEEYEEVVFVEKVSNIVDSLNYVVGTIYCEMDNKPNIFNQVSQSLWVVEPPPVDYYYIDTRKFHLEDDSGRIQLTSSNFDQFAPLVTGAIVAVLGHKSADGSFEVKDIQFPEFPSQSPLDKVDPSQEKYIAIMSNLQLGPNKPINPALEILFDYISGFASGGSDTSPFDSNIAGLILAGSVFAGENPDDTEYVYSHETANNVDQLLDNLSCHIPVFTMPGIEDPSTVTLPQDPLHKGFFPKASKNPNFNSLTNPTFISIGQTKILGTSGQNIDDLVKYSRDVEALDWLEATLKYRHLCPNAPDTLFSFPYKDQDPMIIDDCPHIYFTSNQSKYSSKLVTGTNGQKVRILTIPRFQSNHEVILISLNSLEIKRINLNLN